MAKKYLDYDGLLYLWGKIKAAFVGDVAWDSTNKKITKTKGSTTSDVVTFSTVATSGSYSDLSNKPTIPSAGTGSSYPAMDGTRALGSNSGYARVDHVHPTDTTRAPLASPALTGTPTAPTASASTDSTQIATTAFVHDVVGAMTSGVSDVQVDDTSVVTDGVADIPKATNSQWGVVKVGSTTGGKVFISGGGESVNVAEVGSHGEGTTIATSVLPDATQSAKGAMSAADKTKLDGITYTGVSDVQIGTTSIVSDGVATIPESSSSATGLMTSSQYDKLDGIASGAEVNQNAFSTVKVGTTSLAADSKTDTLTITAGSNITLTPTASSDSFSIAATDTTYSNATTSAAGLMSSTDKTKLDGITYTGVSDVKVAGSSVVTSGVAEIPKANPETFGVVTISTEQAGRTIIQANTINGTAENYRVATVDSSTYKISTNVLPDASQSAKGAMSAADKTKLDSLTITNGVIDASNLPSYVDDVIEAYPVSGATELAQGWLSATSGGSALTPETGKIYVLMTDTTSYAANTQFRWGGTAYVKLADGGVSSITNAEIDTIVAS